MTNDVPITPGEAIKRRRKELGLTQEELGVRAGIDRSTISNIESGNVPIGPERSPRIAEALETTTDALLLPEERPPLAVVLHRLEEVRGELEAGRGEVVGNLERIATLLERLVARELPGNEREQATTE